MLGGGRLLGGRRLLGMHGRRMHCRVARLQAVSRLHAILAENGRVMGGSKWRR
jgi:hypothetical protein